MRGVNKAIVVGRLGMDPELKHTQNGAAYVNLSVATDHVWKDKAGEEQKETEWHRVTVWSKTAEACAKYLRKGSPVYVEGRLRTRSWEEEGKKRYATEIVAREVQFLPAGQKNGGVPAPGDSDVPGEFDYPSSDNDDDDLPF